MNIKVIDEYGNSYSPTYVKRAKNLINQKRAFWVDELHTTICLVTPSKNNMEDNTMEKKDYKRLIAIVEDCIYMCSNSTKFNLGLKATNELARTYNLVVTEIEQASVSWAKHFEKLDFLDSTVDNNDIQGTIDLIWIKCRTLLSALKNELTSDNQDEDIHKNGFTNYCHKIDDFAKNLSEKIEKATLKKVKVHVADKVNKNINNNAEMVEINDFHDKMKQQYDRFRIFIKDCDNDDIKDSLSDAIDDVIDKIDITIDNLDGMIDGLDDTIDEITNMIDELNDYQDDVAIHIHGQTRDSYENQKDQLYKMREKLEKLRFAFEQLTN